MKIINNLFRISAILLLASPFTSCKEEELVKPSALLTESSLTFEAKAEESQSFRIASDSDWMIDVDEPWITVDPMSGSNTMDVNVTVEDNYTGGVMNAPRQGLITIMNKRGYKVTTTIYQNGDTYLGAPEGNVAKVADLDSASRAKVLSATVAAVSTTGFVVTDGTVNMFVDGKAEVKAGDVVDFNGKTSKISGIPSFVLDQVEVKSTAEVTYPTPVAIDKAPSVLPDKVTYVKLTGTLIGSTLRFADKTTCSLLVPADAETFNKVNTHKVDVLAYYIGVIKKDVTVVPVSFVDNGQDESVGVKLPFRDDFSWLAPYIDAANSKLSEDKKISDCVGTVTSSADGCANLYTTLADNGCNVLGELRSRGYTDLNPAFKTIYLQDAYFKFGANKKQSGLTLPLFRLDGEQDIVVSFKWCSQMQGDGNIDKTQLVLEIDGPGKVEPASKSDKISEPVSHSQSSGKMFWQDAMFTIKGATTATAISFHPSVFGHAGAQESGYYRYYVDDIEVMLAADAVKANINVEGLDSDLITFEGTPEAPYTFKVSSDVDFKVSASANWLHIENGSGLAGETKTVSVTCDHSELSVLRKGEITIKSGVTSRKIQVVQSAAGQELDPFISIKEGNSVEVLGQGAEFAVTVQANTSFETKIDADWIQLLPSTTAKVEWTPLKFKAAANLTGVARTGTVRFVKGTIESVLTVKQDKFEPSIKVTTTDNAVPSEGKSLPVHIVSNVDFTASAAGMTLPVSSAKAGTYDLSIPVPANTGAPRKLSVTFENAEYDYKTTFDIYQAGASVVFSDDFSWVAPMVSAWNDANSGKKKKIGDTVGSSGKDAEAPNVYSDATIKASFAAAFKAQGYEDLNPSEKLIYLQDQYLKLGRTKGFNNALRLPKVNALTSPSDVFVEFDHATMCQGDGTCDDAKIVVVIEGDGEFENGTKCSDILPVIQEKGTYRWTHSGTLVKGMTSETRLVVVMYRVVMSKDSEGVYKFNDKYNFKVSGAGRIFLDNIKITK